MNAGDTTYVKGGVYHEKLIRFRKTGTASAPIKLLNAPGESPVIDFGVSKDNRLVQRFEIQSGEGATTPIGWITIEGFEIGHGYEGIKFIGAHDITIRRNWIHHSIGQGILGSGKNMLIDRNTISHNGNSHLDHGLYLSGSNYVISNNRIYGNATYGIQVAGYLWEGSVNYKPKRGTLPDEGYAGASNFLIANNTFAYQGSAGIVIWQAGAVNNRVINSIFYENGVTSRAGSKGVNGVDVLNSGNGHVLNNNVFYASGSGGTRMFARAVEGVHYTQSGNITANPDFAGAGATLPDVPDFHLTAGSPAIDKGLPLPQVTWDHDGGVRPWPSGGTLDIGAYEHGSPPGGGKGWDANDWTLGREAATSPPRRRESGQDPAPPAPASAQTAGPLRVHPTNPRYFTDGTKNADGTLRAVYLTGSHTWASLADIGKGDPPPAFDYDGYLDFLDRHNHNFFRLWREEQVFFLDERFVVTPHPWRRTGPGNALDGKPKFDLTKFNDAYFERLRSRVQAAGRRGIYVAVMLFEGWVLQQKKQEWWRDHPFHPENNINGIDGDANGDGRGTDVHTLSDPAVTRLQEAYVRHVIDTVGDLDNVLYEIANECGSYSTEWQYHLIRFIKDDEAKRPKQHPVGMTFQWSPNSKLRGTNQALFDSPADWISPNQLAGDWNYKSNPPPAEGRKVIVPDTDHLGGIWGNVAWVWKSFTRGHNPIFMDPYDGSVLGEGGSSAWDSIRSSMGDTSQLARRANLSAMTPQGALASTGYCLANLGKEYLVYLPDGGEVSVDLAAAVGSLQVEWFNPRTAEKRTGNRVDGGGKRQFQAPFEGDAVLYLRGE